MSAALTAGAAAGAAAGVNGAGILFIHDDIPTAPVAAAAAAAPAPKRFVLIGKESKYCIDTVKVDDTIVPYCTTLNKPARMGVGKFTVAEFKARQVVSYPGGGTDAEIWGVGFVNAKIAFGNRVMEIMTANPGTRIRYDTPEYDVAEKAFKVNFRFIPARFSYGFPKGGIKPHQFGPTKGTLETPLETATREFKEEVGNFVRIDNVGQLTHLIDTPKNTYRFYYTFSRNYGDAPGIRTEIENLIARRNVTNYGEVFDLEFMEINAANHLHLNAQSREALDAFMGLGLPMAGGRRKQSRRRNKRRSSRRSSSRRK